MKTVYLAGPISGLTYDGVVDWREAVARELADVGIKARLTELGATALALSSAEFGKLIADETEKWGAVIRAANIKPV